MRRIGILPRSNAEYNNIYIQLNGISKELNRRNKFIGTTYIIPTDLFDEKTEKTYSVIDVCIDSNIPVVKLLFFIHKLILNRITTDFIKLL